jgi:hypothetical protein
LMEHHQYTSNWKWDKGLYLCISFVFPFSFGHCVVCPSIYGFWLPICYLQTFLMKMYFLYESLRFHYLLKCKITDFLFYLHKKMTNTDLSVVHIRYIKQKCISYRAFMNKVS